MEADEKLFMKKFNIALDGPSGAGKSSVADRLAAHYDMKHLDTGAMYRALSWLLNQAGIEPDNTSGIEETLKNIDLKMPEGQEVWINGNNVTELIRTPRVSMLASRYASLPAVRQKMVSLQQQIASEKGYIVDGRDICDVVLPDAEVKIYLDASPEARAKRRYLQDQQAGKDVVYEQVLADIEKRDLQDRNREVSPLRVSEQAVLVDSSDLDLDQTVSEICRIADQMLEKEGLL